MVNEFVDHVEVKRSSSKRMFTVNLTILVSALIEEIICTERSKILNLLLNVESRSTATNSSSSNQSRLNTNVQWNQNLRLYPSLKDALSEKPHPLNLVNIPENENKREVIGFEHLNQTVSKENALSVPRSQTFDESFSKQATNTNENCQSKQNSYDLSKQRFKRRGRNRPSSPLPISQSLEPFSTTDPNPLSAPLGTNATATINRKKKKVPVLQSNLTPTSSSSRSSDDERHRSLDERRRQREERQKELVRFRRSQEIQRELDELEQKRLELDRRHTLAKQNLSKETFFSLLNFSQDCFA